MSTFTYNTNIPNGPNNPSTDQPLMQTNTNSINSIIAIDHVGFNVSGGGQHNQVTFNANNVPATPVSPPILFTNSVAALPQLFFYSGDAAHSANQYVANTNGSTFSLGGIIVKWGYVNSPSDNVAINFPVAFPNNCYTISVTPVKSGSVSSLTGFTLKGAPSTTSFTVRFSGTSLDAVTYIAIGN